MRLIPAIDIIDGKCVRLSQGDYKQKTVYNENPIEVAKEFEDHGIQYLHLVDLDGAKSNHVVNWKILEEIATQTGLKVDFGGGVKTNEDIKIVFESGATQVTGGSIAVKNPDLFEEWINQYGRKKIILGADAKNGKIATDGWLESSEHDVTSFIKDWQQKGIEYVICTDISKDGMLAGPSSTLYQKILENSVQGNLSLIASGGVTRMDDVYQLQELGCEGAIIGKAIYENTIKMKDLRNFIEEQPHRKQ